MSEILGGGGGTNPTDTCKNGTMNEQLERPAWGDGGVGGDRVGAVTTHTTDSCENDVTT